LKDSTRESSTPPLETTRKKRRETPKKKLKAKRPKVKTTAASKAGTALKSSKKPSDGRVELCNKLCENAIRPLKIGAKNYMFFGSRRGGELGGADTLIENGKRHGLDLRAYLIETMKALVEHGPSRAAELTPAAFVKARRFAKAS
jgi:hypothetical protein